MSVKVAIATSDGLNIDLHFGQAREFLIYEAQNGVFVQTERRKVPDLPVSDQDSSNPSGGFGCGSGCGGGGGGCCGGGGGPLSPVVELLSDCRAVVAAQFGHKIGRQFERKAISVFDIELPINQALEKLSVYYKKFGDI